MRDYILALCAASIFLCLCNILLPDGTFKKYTAMVCSLILASVMLSPLANANPNIFEGFDVQTERITKEQAQGEYMYYLKRAYEDTIIKELSVYGRVVTEVEENLTVKSIKIYASVYTVIPKDEIQKKYAPEKMEVIYE